MVGTTFPAFIRVEYQDGRGFKQFEAEANDTIRGVQQRFEGGFREITSIAQGAARRAAAGFAGVDFGVEAMRRSAAEARFQAEALGVVATAAGKLATESAKVDQELVRQAQSARAAADEAQRTAAAIESSVAGYERLQAATVSAAAGNDRFQSSLAALNAETSRAAAADAAAQKMAALATEVDRLRASYDPTIAIQRQFNAELDALDASLANGTIRQSEYNELAAASRTRLQESTRAAITATTAQDRLNREFQEFKASIDPAFASQLRFNQAMAQAKRYLDEGKLSAEEYAAAQRRIELATGGLNGLQRQGAIQVGQQLQDVSVGLVSGQNPATVLAQQLPQLALALQQVGSAGDEVGSTLGNVAAFLGSGWGIALTVAIPVLSYFVGELFSASEAADELKNKTYDFTEVLDTRRGSIYEFADAIDKLNESTRQLINTQALLADSSAESAAGGMVRAQAELDDLNRRIAINEQAAVQPGPLFGFGLTETDRRRQAAQYALPRLRAERDLATQALADARSVANAAEIALAQRRSSEALDEGARLTGEYERARARLLQRRQASQALDGPGVPLNDPATEELRRDYLSAEDYQRQDQALVRQNRAAQEALRASQREPRRGPRGPSAATLQRQAFGRAEFGQDTANRLDNIESQFDRTPPAIAKTERALRQLDDLITDINQKANPGERAGLLAQVEQTRAVVEASIADNFREQIELGQQDIEVQSLRLAGLDLQAQQLERQNALMRDFGVTSQEALAVELNRRGISADQYAAYQGQLATMQAMTREAARLDRAGRSVQSRLQAVADIQDTITGSLAQLPNDARGALVGFVDNIRNQFNDLLARRLTDDLFGNIFADLEAEISNSPRARADRVAAQATDAVSEKMRDLERAASSAAQSLEVLAGRGSPANDNAAIDALISENDRNILAGINGSLGIDSADIIVTGARTRSGKTGVKELPDAIDAMQLTFTRLFERYLGTGSPLAADLGDALATGLQGAAIGQTAGGLIFGSSNNATASGIGGALGQIAGEKLGQVFSTTLGSLGQFAGPAGAIVGSIVGNIVGGLLTKPKIGVANIGGGVNGGLEVASFSGNSTRFREAAGQGGDSVISTIDRIAEALGAGVDGGRGSVSIGIRDGKYRVDPSGRGVTKTSRGAIDFGEDAEAAIRAATLDLIKDGVLSGLRASTQRLLQQAKDLDSGLQDALDFEGVFVRLKEYKDPVGSALDALDKEFERLIKLFGEAAASTEEYSALEELYGIERAKAIKEAGERVTASLQGLFDDLTIGNDALSLRTRIGGAQARYDPLAARVAAGDVTAYDDFSAAARELLDLQRQYSGSTSAYFDLLDQVTDLTRTRIDAETNIASIAAGRASPFDDRPASSAPLGNEAVVSAIASQTAAILDGLTGLGADLIRAAILRDTLSNSVPTGFRTASGF